ncbi:APC family permease [Streptomyces sp. NTK 937]|uniref:APC family permease n=1 Tax=Streptomyces sp. NTK 937 TaxID=1487711 RepID=UPI000AFEBEA9|nr:APC family permease [Streptomyces sp. NTK 937]
MTERMRKLTALPVLSADALSSVAYGPEAMVAVLVLAGSAGLAYTFPVAGAILFLMLAVGLSYRQTIRAYPHGGGSYIVASDNLGQVPGLLAAAGLMTDYILTVAVSIASGVAAITSAPPSLAPDTVLIGVAVIVVLLVGNLRGIRQAGALFAAPTYTFVAAMLLLVAFGLADAAGRGFEPRPAPPSSATESLGLLLINGGPLVAATRPALAQEPGLQRCRSAPLGRGLHHRGREQVLLGRVGRHHRRRPVPAGHPTHQAPLRDGFVSPSPAAAHRRPADPHGRGGVTRTTAADPRGREAPNGSRRR